ncbi:P1 family peptidase [Methylobacterium pseudosasicola]|uniref:Peptidase family S58 n=1 Tax=Methylobacterium pseudosasicola TaxID=582667 RepID=A0A1I4HDP1_9HYPH|nr:P1 family peptidase [Methylobacterium pseudosasicola]SFL39753.1 Peptidase family S58 [Methylobacterium pseudosasicola]
MVRPHGGDVVRDRVPSVTVLNGFGKSVGLTNTFSVSAVAAAQIRAPIATNPGMDRVLSTVDPLVFACNDGPLNDIRRMAVAGAPWRTARSVPIAACRASGWRAAPAPLSLSNCPFERAFRPFVLISIGNQAPD